MISGLHGVAVLAAALFVGGVAAGVSQAVPVSADQGAVPVGATAPPQYDPKKKMPGDACKTAGECQAHHTCEKVGDHQVCKAPPPPRLPPGAVT